jgi:uncharacterized membrane protein
LFLVNLMKVEEAELIQLRTVYDELWRDAKTMIKDMRRSIMIYAYSGSISAIIGVYSLISAILYSLAIITGDTSLLNYFYAVFDAFASVAITLFSIKLLKWHSELKRRYSKLIEMEKTIED